MGKNTNEELLDAIALKAECCYLSDVGLPIYKENVLKAIEEISEDEYSLQQWQEAVRYITGENTHIGNCRQVKEYLRQKLRKKQF